MKLFDGANLSLVNLNKERNDSFFGFPFKLVCLIAVLFLIVLNHILLLTTSHSKLPLKQLYTMLFALVIPKGLITSSGFKFITDLMKL